MARAAHDETFDGFAERVAAEVGARALRGRLGRALSTLHADDRDVLLLVAWGDLGYAQVAQALDIPLGTVRSRLHRARQHLRAALGGIDPTMIGEES